MNFVLSGKGRLCSRSLCCCHFASTSTPRPISEFTCKYFFFCTHFYTLMPDACNAICVITFIMAFCVFAFIFIFGMGAVGVILEQLNQFAKFGFSHRIVGK